MRGALSLCLLCACVKYEPAATLALSAAKEDYSGVWPDDRLLHASKLETARFPNPFAGTFASILFETGDRLLDGFGLQAPIFVPFSGPIDVSTLPQDAQATLATDATVRLFVTDSKEQVPFDWKWFSDATPFLAGNVLAVRPLLGFPLLPKTKYTLLVTTAVHDVSGAAVGPDRETWVAEALGVAIAVRFTTQSLLDELIVLRDFLEAQPAPELHSTALTKKAYSNAVVYDARYPAPLLLQGEPPYALSGADFAYDEAGVPLVAATEDMRLTVVLPKLGCPAGGCPFVMYSHGTGGDYTSVIGDIGTDLAALGIASIGIDQVLHGTRVLAGSSCFGQAPEICFFNPVNAQGGRNLSRQSALDHVTLVRALEGLEIGGQRLDTTRMGYFGHSQGGLSGALYVAIEPRLKAVVLSGTGGYLTNTVLQRKEPIDLLALAEGFAFLNLQGQDKLDAYHPAIALMQTLGEASDPMNYARYWLDNTPSLFLTSGNDDPYTPAAGTVAMAAAAGVAQLLPDATVSPAHELRGILPIAFPVRGSVEAKTAVLRQFPGEGHYPVFHAVARPEWHEFFVSAFRDFPVAASLSGP